MSPGEFCLVECLGHKGIDSALKSREDAGGKQGPEVALWSTQQNVKKQSAGSTGRGEGTTSGEGALGSGEHGRPVRTGAWREAVCTGRAQRGGGMCVVRPGVTPLPVGGCRQGEGEELARSPREREVRALLSCHLPPRFDFSAIYKTSS